MKRPEDRQMEADQKIKRQKIKSSDKGTGIKRVKDMKSQNSPDNFDPHR